MKTEELVGKLNDRTGAMINPHFELGDQVCAYLEEPGLMRAQLLGKQPVVAVLHDHIGRPDMIPDTDTLYLDVTVHGGERVRCSLTRSKEYGGSYHLGPVIGHGPGLAQCPCEQFS